MKMPMDLRIRHLDVPDLVAAAWKRRTAIALRTLASRIRRVTVTVAGETGEEYEVLCRVRIETLEGRSLVVSNRSRDAGRALAMALDSAARATHKQVARHRLERRRAS